MTLSTGQTVVGNTATLIYTAESGSPDTIEIHDPSGGQSVFVGTADVTALTGLELGAGDNDLKISLTPGESIYAITTAGTQRVSWLVVQ